MHAVESVQGCCSFSRHISLQYLPHCNLALPAVSYHGNKFRNKTLKNEIHFTFQEVRKRLPGEIAAAANRAGRWINQMGCVAHNGCCRRTAHVWALHLALWKLLVSEELHQPLLQLEMPLVGFHWLSNSYQIIVHNLARNVIL